MTIVEGIVTGVTVGWVLREIERDPEGWGLAIVQVGLKVVEQVIASRQASQQCDYLMAGTDFLLVTE